MPKIVDHEERRKRLVEAVWALAVRGGIEQVTLRKVADEAGVSMGQVQHYYSSMHALVRDALDRAVRAVHSRIETSVRAAGATGPEDLLRICLHALTGPDEESTRLMRFSLAAAGRAVSDPTMATVLAPGDDELLSFTAGLIAAARQERGGAPCDEDRLDADICWSLAASLGVDVALGYRTPDAAGRMLDHHLDRLLGPQRQAATA
ncbi:TetR family transcriptional regulator C-terminal domain-containing protein [Streptomyces sp. RS10V-4]|uniref:TetR/AcrR family transcriptional regulator n=1 Tax=Streptomyces rhizoryzae TaxID=2932493 RepID=UPI002004089D|nr:TetR family transcriptional regulator C-terminal domain-containing protein [Streptomyces rhizoryzae]MCK7622981.1 TetR family transcriptional regulator C-terminal domain-containing protein [Streptomyces rhizoryzae]